MAWGRHDMCESAFRVSSRNTVQWLAKMTTYKSSRIQPRWNTPYAIIGKESWQRSPGTAIKPRWTNGALTVINRDFQSLCFTKTSPAVYIFVKNQRVSPHKKMWGGGERIGCQKCSVRDAETKIKSSRNIFPDERNTRYLRHKDEIFKFSAIRKWDLRITYVPRYNRSQRLGGGGEWWESILWHESTK